MRRHVVIGRVMGNYEVWEPCPDTGCNTYHSKVGDFPSKFDAEKVACLLDGLLVKPKAVAS